MIQGQLVSLGLLTIANRVYSVVASISTMSSYMRLTGAQTLTENLRFSSDTFTCSGAKPSEIGYLSGVTSSVQTQLMNCAPKANPTFTGTVSIPGSAFTGALNFPSTITLGTNLSAAKMVLWP